jgi:hypothetical protein
MNPSCSNRVEWVAGGDEEKSMSLYDWVSDSMVDEGERRGSVRVGWLLTEKKGAVLYDAPERIRSADMNREHAKSASRCPAVINMESRYFVIKCPFTMHLGFERGKDGTPRLVNRLGDKSPLRGSKLAQLVTLVAESEWRYKDRPFMHYLRQPWPGTLFGGRFPIHVWPRPLMWAFEWHDTSKDLILRRGDPWFYAGFETLPADRPISVVEAEMTPELDDYTQQISGAGNYAGPTFSLFKNAEKRRPRTLLKPVAREAVADAPY